MKAVSIIHARSKYPFISLQATPLLSLQYKRAHRVLGLLVFRKGK